MSSQACSHRSITRAVLNYIYLHLLRFFASERVYDQASVIFVTSKQGEALRFTIRKRQQNSTLLTRQKRLHCSLRSILVVDWLRHRRLALYLRRRILAWLLRIAWIRRRRLSIALRGLVVIPWRRVLLHLLLHGRRLGCRHDRLVSRLRQNHCPRWRTMAVVRATCTTKASHDGNSDREKHDRADYSGGNNTSAPNSYVSSAR